MRSSDAINSNIYFVLVMPEYKLRKKRAVPNLSTVITPISATVELMMIVDYSIWSNMSSSLDSVVENSTSPMISLLLYYTHLAMVVR